MGEVEKLSYAESFNEVRNVILENARGLILQQNLHSTE